MKTQTITDISPNKNNDRHSIFLEGNFAFSLSQTDILYYKLEIGKSLTEAQIEIIKTNTLQTKSNATAQNFLAYKPRSYKEMKQKLSEKDYPPDIIETTLETLCKYDYLNDERYAKSYITHKKNLGQVRLSYELRLKGIEERLINQALADHFDDQEDIYDTISQLFNKKLSGDTDPSPKEKQRAFNFVLRRGFYYDDVQQGYNRYLEQ